MLQCRSIAWLLHGRGRKAGGEKELSKYHSNKIFPLLWDAHSASREVKWKRPVIGLCPTRGTREKERETYFLWGKTQNKMNRVTVEGKLLTAKKKEEPPPPTTTDDCKRAAVWVSDRIQLQTERLPQQGSDCTYVYGLWSARAACRSSSVIWLRECVNWNSSRINTKTREKLSKDVLRPSQSEESAFKQPEM